MQLSLVVKAEILLSPKKNLVQMLPVNLVILSRYSDTNYRRLFDFTCDNYSEKNSKIKRFLGGQSCLPKMKNDRFLQAKQEMGMTKEQQEEAKRNYLEQVQKVLDFSNLGENELRDKIKEIHQRICRLEADKYDLEKRNERQEYDVSKK